VLLQSQTDAVWALARTYVSGAPADYPAAWAVQDQLKVIRPAGTAASTWSAVDLLAPPPDSDWAAYFAYVDQLLTAAPPPSVDSGYLASGPNTIGVGAGMQFDPAAIQGALVASGVSEARLRALSSTDVVTATGWSHASATIGAYGTDYALRAHLAVSGLGALPTQEAVYFIANAAAATPGTPLAGTTVYEIVFPPGQWPPTGAFWSLTLYEGQDPDHEYFYANPGGIYAVSYPASAPVVGADGSLTLTISNVLPAGVPASNWLPAPEGTYSLQLRDYLPPATVLDNTYVLPAVTAVPS
jgi:hypothetical protein